MSCLSDEFWAQFWLCVVVLVLAGMVLFGFIYEERNRR